ncbi:cell division protein DivIVA [Qaidamihabitans albus]|uniref:cell division protein DivIVA n=1 Tax=Qaidamihabitans albus TaxID=2795733 RepID=UPI0018F22340|nr:cell division protein DivIVA [Qaidamihabitans albus]
MASERDNGLLPLRREFSQAWHGFDRNQVLQYVDHIETQLRRLMSDRDSARAQINTVSRELDNARREINKLHDRIEELKKPPERIEDLDERMQRTVRLANARAEEIIARAQEGAEKHWAESSTVSDKLHQRYMKLLETLDGHADALQREHEEALASTKAEVEKMTTEAVRRRERLDSEAENRRRTIEREFDAKMTAERNALDKYIADQKTASKNQAERRISEATTEAKRLVDEAGAEAERILDEAKAEAERRTTEANDTVERLARIREEARARLKEADKVLKEGESALVPVQDEDADIADLPASQEHDGVRLRA